MGSCTSFPTAADGGICIVSKRGKLPLWRLSRLTSVCPNGNSDIRVMRSYQMVALFVFMTRMD